MTIKKNVFGENHADIASCYNDLANLYHEKGRCSPIKYQNHFDLAEEFHLKALKIRISLYGENHADVAGSYNNLGNLYGDRKKRAILGEKIEEYVKKAQEYGAKA